MLFFKKNKLDYYANTYPEPSTFPDGMDIEIFKYKTLKISNKLAKNKSEREHVTVLMRHFKKFKSKRYDQKNDLSKYRLTIDFSEDFKLFTKIIDHFGKKIIFTIMEDLIKFLSKNKKLINYQKKLIRNQSFYRDILNDHLID